LINEVIGQLHVNGKQQKNSSDIVFSGHTSICLQDSKH